MLVALGWSNKRIAAALYVTLPTLRKHYFSELKFRDVARDRLNSTMACKLWGLFMAGNVAAGKEFRSFLEINDRMEFETAMGSPAGDKTGLPERVGKKVLDERRAADADADLMAELEQEATSANAVH